MHESTSPLLRQIRALQEEGRARASAWASAESALSDRAIAAEESASVAEAKAHAAQTQAAEAHASNRLADQALRECKLSLAVAIADGKAASVKASNAADRIAEVLIIQQVKYIFYLFLCAHEIYSRKGSVKKLIKEGE